MGQGWTRSASIGHPQTPSRIAIEANERADFAASRVESGSRARQHPPPQALLSSPNCSQHNGKRQESVTLLPFAFAFPSSISESRIHRSISSTGCPCLWLSPVVARPTHAKCVRRPRPPLIKLRCERHHLTAIVIIAEISLRGARVIPHLQDSAHIHKVNTPSCDVSSPRKKGAFASSLIAPTTSLAVGSVSSGNSAQSPCAQSRTRSLALTAVFSNPRKLQQK